jgi:hypothetical protein
MSTLGDCLRSTIVSQMLLGHPILSLLSPILTLPFVLCAGPTPIEVVVFSPRTNVFGPWSLPTLR